MGPSSGTGYPTSHRGFGAQSSKSVILPCSPAPTDLGEPALLPNLAREKQMLLFTVHRGSGVSDQRSRDCVRCCREVSRLKEGAADHLQGSGPR